MQIVTRITFAGTKQTGWFITMTLIKFWKASDTLLLLDNWETVWEKAGGWKIKVKEVQEEIEASNALCSYNMLGKQAIRFIVLEKEKEFAKVSSAQLSKNTGCKI